MDKKTPRYKNDIFVTSKHLTRTINTYIEYEDVTKIYVSFNKEQNKYQIFIELENELRDFETDDMILVYKKTDALLHRTDTDRILQVLNDIDIKQLHKKNVLEKFKQLIVNYQRDKDLFNSFFEREKTQMIDKLKSIIDIKGSFVQKPSGQSIQTSDMVAKRLYYTILNKLNYYQNSSNKISGLINQVKKDDKERIEQVQDDLESLKFSIEDIHKRKERVYVQRNEYIHFTYKECVIALELFDDSEFDINDIAPAFGVNELITEKTFHEEALEADIMEENIKNKFESTLKTELAKYFQDFIKIDRYFTVNKKNFTSNAISRYINEFLKQMKILDKLGGTKRRVKVNELTRIYGKNFRDFYKKVKKFSIEEKHLFIKKLFLLKDYIYLLNVFNETDIEDIFHGKILFEYTQKQPFQGIITLSELKIFDQYEMKRKQLEQLQYRIFSDDISPNDDEYNEIIEDISNLEYEIRDLNLKYQNHKYHPWALQYFQDKIDEAEIAYQEDIQAIEEEKEYNQNLIEKYKLNTDDWYTRVDDLYDLLGEKGLEPADVDEDIATLICAKSYEVKPNNLNEWMIKEYLDKRPIQDEDDEIPF